MGIDFTGNVQVQDTVEIQQKSIDRDSPSGSSLTAILVVRRQGLPDVDVTLRFKLDDYKTLTGPEQARTNAVRARLDYNAVRPVIQQMLQSPRAESVAHAARQVCVLAFDVAAAADDATAIRGGTPTMRKAAADVYSTNVAHDVVGGNCSRLHARRDVCRNVQERGGRSLESWFGGCRRPFEDRDSLVRAD